MTEKRRFRHWAFLNEKGMDEWGEIFPNREIPVKVMFPRYMNLGGELKRAFLLYIPELSNEQFESIIDKLHVKFNAPKALIRKDFLESGIPIREELTSGSGTNQIGLFL